MENPFKLVSLICVLSVTLTISCVEVEYDCGVVSTRILDLNQCVGTFSSPNFSKSRSVNFEEAAILIEVGNSVGGEDCYTYTPMPQIIESITITSSKDILSGGAEYLSGENLNELFMLENKGQVFSVSEFITAQNNDPTIFYSAAYSDKTILQLLEKPDASISQSFNILFSFTDSETLNVEIPKFEVTN